MRIFLQPSSSKIFKKALRKSKEEIRNLTQSIFGVLTMIDHFFGRFDSIDLKCFQVTVKAQQNQIWMDLISNLIQLNDFYKKLMENEKYISQIYKNS